MSLQFSLNESTNIKIFDLSIFLLLISNSSFVLLTIYIGIELLSSLDLLINSLNIQVL